jgi:uncharacterized protein YndB with AHSA1/START domain
MNASTDRIEREILLKAPLDKVWKALSDAESFGEWFGASLKGQRFVAGEHTRGSITYPGYEHLMFDVLVERVESPRVLAFSWHPYAHDPAVDYSHEPMTLVVFELESVKDGTLLRVVESGFDRIPLSRRDDAFRMNSSGWTEQMTSIQAYVDR